VCNSFASVDGLPNTAVDFQFKVSEDLLLEYNLDMFKRWRLYPVVIVDGFPFRGLSYNLGLASDGWLDEYFGESDEDFELWRSYSSESERSENERKRVQ
jgi:hypothetical protein